MPSVVNTASKLLPPLITPRALAAFGLGLTLCLAAAQPAVARTSPRAAGKATPAAPAPSGPVAGKDGAKQSLGGLSAPNGPMDVRADRAEYVRDGTSKLTGNVTLRSDTFSMNANAMTLKQQPDGEFQGRLTGTPAHLEHKPEQPGDPLMTAQSSVMTYDTRTQIVELQGDARVTRGTDVITGNLIRYSVADRRVEAVGGSKGRDGSRTDQVRIILTPTKKPGKGTPRKDSIPDEPLTLGTDKVFGAPADASPTPATPANP